MTRERWATAAFFAANGAVYGSVFPRLPELVDRYDLTAATLGAVLFVPVVASLAGSAGGGRIVVRLGARTTSRIAVVTVAIALAVMVASPSLAGLLVAFGALGFGDGVMDVAMNMHAVDLDTRIGRPIMQSLHAAWSGGALTASIAAGVVAGRVPLAIHLAVAGAVIGLIGVVLPSMWAPVRTPVESGGLDTIRAIRTLVVVTVGVAFVESVPIDWASVFTTHLFDATPPMAAAATTAALGGMFVGRVVGDPAVARFGSRRTVIGFSLLSACGAGMAVVSPTIATGYAALALAGFGSSVIFPAIVSVAGRITDGGVAAVTSGSRIGFMTAPIITGTIADRFGFRPIMLVPALIGVGVAGWARTTEWVSDRARPSP